MGLNSHAHLIKIDEYFLDSPLGDENAEIDWVEDTLNESGLINLGKDGVEVPSGTEISWDYSGANPAAFLWYVLIKDGRVDTVNGKKHLYALYEVTPDQQIVGTGIVGFDYENKGVSHQTFMGKTNRRPPQEIPDGGATAALLGLGILGLGALSRKR